MCNINNINISHKTIKGITNDQLFQPNCMYQSLL